MKGLLVSGLFLYLLYFFSLIEGDVLSVLCLQVKPVSMLDEMFKLKTVQYQSVLARDEQMCLLRLVQFSF